MKHALLYISAVICLVGETRAAALAFTDRASFDAAHPAAMIEGWDGFADGTTFVDGTGASGITYFSSSGDALVTSFVLATTSPHGLGNTTLGFFGAPDTVTFAFDAPQIAFGIDISTFDSFDGAYTATTDTGEVIGSFFDPFPSFGVGQFVGFSTTIPFLSVTIAAVGTEPYTLDTLRHVSAPVPEPTSMALFGLGVAGLNFVGGRYKKTS